MSKTVGQNLLVCSHRASPALHELSGTGEDWQEIEHDMSAARPRPTPGPFSGLLVIDLTHVLNGPSATTILSDLGARVIKIEPPGHGDDTRTYGPFFREVSLYFSFVNRGKESIVLNLKEDADRTDEVVHMAANPVNHTHRVRDTSLRDWLLLRSPRARWTQ